MQNWIRKISTTPILSVIVIVYNMQREGIRTIHSLSRKYQLLDLDIPYEIIVVDNGSSEIFKYDDDDVEKYYKFRYIENAGISPASAVNAGIAMASGKYIGIMVDGARMLTPGVLRWALMALKLSTNPVVCVPGLHLGPEHQGRSTKKGYSKQLEDELLRWIDWRANGYNLFKIGCWADSCKGGPFSSMAESNCIFMKKSLAKALGGFEEKFQSTGGGLVNLDFFSRACTFPDTNVYYIQGEGCFHQLHGGVTTGGSKNNELQQIFHREYKSIRNKDYSVPSVPFSIIGHAPIQTIQSFRVACTNILNNELFFSKETDISINNWLSGIGFDRGDS